MEDSSSILLVIDLAITAAVALFLWHLSRNLGGQHNIGKDVRDELRSNRDESRTASKELREEIATSLRHSTEALAQLLEGAAKGQNSQLELMAAQIKDLSTSNHTALEKVRGTLDDRVKELQSSNETRLNEVRHNLLNGLKAISDALDKSLDGIRAAQQSQLESMSRQLKELAESNHAALDKIRSTLDDRGRDLQQSNETKLNEIRKESADGLKLVSDTLTKSVELLSKGQQSHLESMTNQLRGLTESNQATLERIRTTFDDRVKELQQSNEKKLDEMRKTVDEKLHDSLEKRLGESFKLVSDRLDAVHKGLGEMQSLATGVGDLKRVLTNVKARGTWAEVQLGALLEQILTPQQYERNVIVKPDTSERVEFAVRLPGTKEEPGCQIWLPIDSKFPQEDYVRLQDAADKGDTAATASAAEALARAVKICAKDIHDKYIYPPSTTDFAIMFLATEGLYAEVLRQPALAEDIQQKFRVVIAGPTTLIAILSSLRMGFQTLAIEQRASEVWQVLGAVKTEFGKFGDVLDKVKKQLNTAARTIDETGTRSRALERKLRSVEQLSDVKTAEILSLPELTNTESLDIERSSTADMPESTDQ